MESIIVYNTTLYSGRMQVENQPLDSVVEEASQVA